MINKDGILQNIVAYRIILKFNVNPVKISQHTNKIEKYVYWSITILKDNIYKIINETKGLSIVFFIFSNESYHTLSILLI